MGLCSLGVDSLAVSIRDAGALSASTPIAPSSFQSPDFVQVAVFLLDPLCTSAEVAPKRRGASGL